MHSRPPHVFSARVRRATQIDGLRAFAMIGVACVHWIPKAWRGALPLEIGLYFFLALTGFLITGALLRERDRGETGGHPWKAHGLRDFQWRRGLRILGPYYAAIALSWLLRVPDVVASPFWYLTQTTNIHIALSGWPNYTAHFWSLAVQQQFYVLWPFVVWWLPRRWLAPSFAILAMAAPACRLLEPWLRQWFVIPDALTLQQFDYLASGSLLALAAHHGMAFHHRGLRRAAWACTFAWGVLYCLSESGHRVPVLHAFQQTFLAVACCGLIAAAIEGFHGWRRGVLNHPAIQHLGRLSYSLYLFHNLAPLVLGWIAPWLWNGHFETGWGFLFRITTFALVSWGLAWLSWRYIETPSQRLKSRPAAAA